VIDAFGGVGGRWINMLSPYGGAKAFSRGAARCWAAIASGGNLKRTYGSGSLEFPVRPQTPVRTQRAERACEESKV